MIITKIDHQSIIQTLRKIGVDAASFAILFCVVGIITNGILIIYGSYYDNSWLPPNQTQLSPAMYNFTAGISFFYLFLQTRKYRNNDKQNKEIK